MEESQTITSSSNPLIKRIKRLQEKTRSRQRERAFFVEGVPITLTALESHAPVETIVYAQTLLTDERGRIALERQKTRGTPCVAVSERVFRNVSQRNNPDGLGAICQTTWTDLDRIVPKPSDVFVAMECVSDPGNLGTILRTMDSVQAAALILVGQSTNPFHPRTVRSSRGTVFTVPLCGCPDMETVFKWAGAHQVHSVATSANARCSFWVAAYQLPVLCIFGNEHRGLDAKTMAAAEQSVTIPMGGRSSSLNVSIAVSLLVYEIKRIAQAGPVGG